MNQINVTSSWIAISKNSIKKVDWIIDKKWTCLYKNSKLNSDFYVSSKWVVLISSQFLFLLLLEE